MFVLAFCFARIRTADRGKRLESEVVSSADRIAIERHSIEVHREASGREVVGIGG
jgi:hypothetical protein